MAAEKYREKYRKSASYMGENDFFLAGAKWADRHPVKKGIYMTKASALSLVILCLLLISALFILLLIKYWMQNMLPVNIRFQVEYLSKHFDNPVCRESLRQLIKDYLKSGKYV